MWKNCNNPYKNILKLMMFLSFLLKNSDVSIQTAGFPWPCSSSTVTSKELKEFESTSPRAVGRLGVPDIMIFCCGFDDV